MTHDVDDVPALLNSLIEVCLDGEHGYLTAAADVNNSELASTFRQYGEQRAKFVKELSAEVVRLGGEPVNHGSVTGALHRGWLSVKSTLTGSSPEAIVAACETGEDSAAATFEQAVDTTITGETRAMVERQAKQIREAHSHLLRLKKDMEQAVGASERT